MYLEIQIKMYSKNKLGGYKICFFTVLGALGNFNKQHEFIYGTCTTQVSIQKAKFYKIK